MTTSVEGFLSPLHEPTGTAAATTTRLRVPEDLRMANPSKEKKSVRGQYHRSRAALYSVARDFFEGFGRRARRLRVARFLVSRRLPGARSPCRRLPGAVAMTGAQA